MKSRTGSWRAAGRIAAFVAASMLSPSLAAQAQRAPIDPEAQKLLRSALEYLANQKQYSVTVEAEYDAPQRGGQKIEFGETRRITVARPDKLRVEIEESNGAAHLLVFDGKDISFSTPASKVYAQLPKPGTLDHAVVFFVRDLGMRLPLAMLFLTTAPDEVDHRTRALAYVEKTGILGKPAHHLAGRTDDVDYQAWVADGEQPLLLRIVLTYRTAQGQPQYRAQLSDWNLTPQVQDSMFTFTPATDARRIAFLAEMPRAAKAAKRAGSGAKPSASGGGK